MLDPRLYGELRQVERSVPRRLRTTSIGLVSPYARDHIVDPFSPVKWARTLRAAAKAHLVLKRRHVRTDKRRISTLPVVPVKFRTDVNSNPRGLFCDFGPQLGIIFTSQAGQQVLIDLQKISPEDTTFSCIRLNRKIPL